MATIKTYVDTMVYINRQKRRREKAVTSFLTEVRENQSKCFRGYGYIIQYINKKWTVSEDNKYSGTIRTVTYKEVKQLLTDSYYL